ncbi:hypothetical protein H0H81_001179 [Sphagnurus paluster]|uniref:Uncharacterized protein n=1 Tax=Sphagnurus paluster TaxID=117069 RepID=A0A9P7KLC3_9AGAR|nr:hypothetical protein H0H81_001179 [Sphagnurus paluster]
MAQDAETHARNDKKLIKYTELSSTLAKVSPSAAAGVMPTLAEILLRHAQGKQRAEENLNAISGVWNQVFDLFVTEISRAIDAKLEEAIEKIRQQTELYLVHRYAPLQISAPPRRTNDHDAFSPKPVANFSQDDTRRSETSNFYGKARGADDSRDFQHEQKRRRFSSVSPIPEVKPQRSSLKLDSSMHEILTQMKTKIDAQAQSLQKLTKENTALKASLHQRPSITSCSSLTPAA